MLLAEAVVARAVQRQERLAAHQQRPTPMQWAVRELLESALFHTIVSLGARAEGRQEQRAALVEAQFSEVPVAVLADLLRQRMRTPLV